MSRRIQSGNRRHDLLSLSSSGSLAICHLALFPTQPLSSGGALEPGRVAIGSLLSAGSWPAHNTQVSSGRRYRRDLSGWAGLSEVRSLFLVHGRLVADLPAPAGGLLPAGAFPPVARLAEPCAFPTSPLAISPSRLFTSSAPVCSRSHHPGQGMASPSPDHFSNAAASSPCTTALPLITRRACARIRLDRAAHHTARSFFTNSGATARGLPRSSASHVSFSRVIDGAGSNLSSVPVAAQGSGCLSRLATGDSRLASSCERTRAHARRPNRRPQRPAPMPHACERHRQRDGA